MTGKWHLPFNADPSTLTEEQIRILRERGEAMREYYRTGDPRECIQLGIFPEGYKGKPPYRQT